MPGAIRLKDILLRLMAAAFAASIVAGVALDVAHRQFLAEMKPRDDSLLEFVVSTDRLTLGMRLTCVTAGALVFALVLVTSFRARDTKTLMILLFVHGMTVVFAIVAAGMMTALHAFMLVDHH